MEDTNKDRLVVYEIGYIIADSIAEENVSAETESLRKILVDAGANMIAEESPKSINLAYEMRKKTVSGLYNKFNKGYFGWFKFELLSDKIELVKRTFDAYPSVLRMLLITTVKENTYLGKNVTQTLMEESKPESNMVTAKTEEVNLVPATQEEMDKSIDNMVKGA